MSRFLPYSRLRYVPGADATNVVPCSTTKSIPFELMFGRHAHSTTAPMAIDDAAVDLVHEKDLQDLAPGELGAMGSQVTAALSTGADPITLRRLGVSGMDSLCSILAILVARNAPYSLVGAAGMPFRKFEPAAQINFAREARSFLALSVTADSVAECNAVVHEDDLVDAESLSTALKAKVALDDRALGFVAVQFGLNVFLISSNTEFRGEEIGNRVTFICVRRFAPELPSVVLFCRHHVTFTDLDAFSLGAGSSASSGGHVEATVDNTECGIWASDHHIVAVCCLWLAASLGFSAFLF